MINKINKIIDNTKDKMVLKTLKLEITNEKNNIDEILTRYINEYEEKSFKTTNYDINLGYTNTLKDYKKTLNKIKPYSNPKNYHKMAVKAKGNWKNIYEIAFGTPNITITTKNIADEKTKQRKIKGTI